MGLFNYNGKSMPLPPNRFLQFFYLIKENFLLLFYTSITYFIFNLPLIYILISTFIKYRNLLENSATSNELFSTLLSASLLIIPAMLILSIATTGMHYIIKKISYNEATLYKDFFLGIKENILDLAPLYIADAIFSAMIIINYAIYLYLDINPIVKLIALIISMIIFILIKLIKPFYMAQNLIFENNKIQQIKNSITFATVKLIRNIGILLLSNLLIILILLLPEKLRVVAMVISIILGGAYNLLISHLNSLYIIEKYINKDNYQEIYHKGLIDFYKKDDENV